jgi:dephospho-CoA kinase
VTPEDGTNYLRIGVTGGIGSGKSTVCALFASRGRVVIYADAIARDLTEHDAGIREQIKKAFGVDIYRTDGSLQRKKLAEIVFTDPRLRKKLDSIVHPRVFEAIDRAITMLDASGRSPYVMVEAALIFESGMDAHLDYTVVVDAPENVRISRVISRDACTRDEVMIRIQSQMPVEQKLKRADFVIDNGGDETELAARVAFLDALFCHMAVI